jgi:hypothetical protein
MVKTIVLSFIFSLYSMLGYSQSEKNKKKHFVGTNINFFPINFWTLPDYFKHIDHYENGEKRQINLINLSGINYQFEFKKWLKFQTGVLYSEEKCKFHEFRYKGNSSKCISIDYNVEYLTLPVNIKLFPGNAGSYASEKTGGFFIQLGLNFDFIIHENIISRTYTYRDYRLPPPPLGYVYVDPNKKLESINSRKIKYNRVSSTIMIGHEIVFDHFLFYYGCSYQFISKNQKHNTQETILSSKFCPINLGLSYRF